MSVCGNCGLAAIKKKEGYICKTCKSNDNIKEIAIPYASKLLFQELMAMQIAPRIIVKNNTKNIN